MYVIDQTIEPRWRELQGTHGFLGGLALGDATPHRGRVYHFVRNLLQLYSVDRTGFKRILSTRFRPGARPCLGVRTRGCSYSAFIIGESSHDHQGEQNLALEMIDHVAGLFPANAFTLREETTSTGSGALGPGILNGGVAAPATSAIIQRRGIVTSPLRGDEQFWAERWVPAFISGAKKLITYTGNAHTSRQYFEHFRRGLPRIFNMSPGRPILSVVRAHNQQGLVLTIDLANEIMQNFEEQAYREKLREFPSPAQFSRWLTIFRRHWNALFTSFQHTKIYHLAHDVYWALVPPYSGLQFDQLVEIAWAAPRFGGRIRQDRSWTLNDIFNNRIRFEDDNKKGKHFLKVEVDWANRRLASLPEEEHF